MLAREHSAVPGGSRALLRLAALLHAAPSSGWAVGLGNVTADIDEPGANGTGMLWRWSRDTNDTTESRASVLGSQRGTGLSGGITWSLDPPSAISCSLLSPRRLGCNSKPPHGYQKSQS